MKQKIKFSAYSLAMTSIVLLLFIVGIISLLDNVGKLILFCVIMGTIIIFGLYYCPKFIVADEYALTLHRVLASPMVFPYSSLQSADTCYPVTGIIRVWASCGFFGYWGYFQDYMIGSYVGCYGDRNNCILVKTKDGHQYVLGCDDADALISCIDSQLK